jgi:GNAT superfamily N-acetyltransferase
MIKQETFQFSLISSHGTELDKYKELHNIFFKGAAVSIDWINWYHNEIGSINGAYSGTRTYGAFDEDRLIGIWSVEPKTLKVKDDEDIKVGRCFAVGIHPDYRRRGLFVQLSEYAIKQERERGEYEYILGYPQVGRTVIGGHLKAGWEVVQDIQIYSSEPSVGSVYPRSMAKVIYDFNAIKFPDKLHGSYNENADYRNLRWLQHPDLQYTCLNHGDAYIVLKPYSNFCHILDIKGSEKNVYTLLEISKTLAKRHGWTELNVWCADNEIYKKQILDAGFKCGANHGLAITMIAVRIKAKGPLVLNDCHIPMGVEEGY